MPNAVLWTRTRGDISPSPKSLLIDGWTYIIGEVCVCGYHTVKTQKQTNYFLQGARAMGSILEGVLCVYFLPSPYGGSNGEVVEGADHSTVVQLIRNSGKEVNLVVVSVSDEEARKLEPEGASGGNVSAMDYFERRSVPISVPDTRKTKDDGGKEYVMFNIYMANKHMASRRYREFDALNSNVSLLC